MGDDCEEVREVAEVQFQWVSFEWREVLSCKGYKNSTTVCMTCGELDETQADN